MRDPKARRAAARAFKFFSVALAVIERDEMDERLLDSDLVREGDGIESAGTDDERLRGKLLVLTG